MRAQLLILSLAAMLGGASAASACDPKAEEANMQALFQSRVLDEGQQKQFFEKLAVDGKEIGDAIEGGRIDEACAKIEVFKAYVETLPAK